MRIQRYSGGGSSPEAGPRRFEHQPETPIDDLAHYLKVLRRRWWLVAVMGALGLGFAWWSGRGDIPVYTAEALLQERSEAPVVAQGGPAGGSEEFAAHLETIRSRSALRTVVDSLALQLNLRDHRARRSALLQEAEIEPAAPRGGYALQSVGGELRLSDVSGQVLGAFSPGELVVGPGFRLAVAAAELARLEGPLTFSISDAELAVESLRRRLRIEQGRARNMIWIRYSDPDAEHAARVVNAVASQYRRYRAETARQLASRRRAVIEEQLVQLADSLERVQDRVLEYQRNNELLDPRVEGNALLTERLSIESELRNLRFQEALLAGLVTDLRGGGSGDEIQQRLLGLGDGVVPGAGELQGRLQSLLDERRRLTASRFGYTDRAPQVQALDTQSEAVRAQIRIAAETSLALLRDRIENTSARLGQLRADVGTAPAVTADFTQLQQRVEAVQGVYDVLVEEYYEAQIAENVEAGDIAVVDPASVPLYPDPSGGPIRMGFALLAGFMVGAVGAVTLDQFDKRVVSVPDVEEAARIPVLGTVPRIRSRSPETLEMRAGREAFRALRTSLRFALATPPRTMVVTSAEPGEGKSTVAANLAVAMAEQGLKVALLDCDLRRPRLHRIFGVPGAPGLTEVLSGGAALGSVIRRHSGATHLDVIPGGEVVEHAAELMGGEAFRDLLRELEEAYDVVLIDTAPVLAFADASVVARAADAAMLVARAERTDREALRESVERLQKIGAPLVGIILNGMPLDASSSSYYDYYYGAGREGRSRHPLLGAGARSGHVG